MEPILEKELTCPYCGEPIQLLIDVQEIDSSYTEDCQVCCRPMVVSVTAYDTVEVHREDEV